MYTTYKLYTILLMYTIDGKKKLQVKVKKKANFFQLWIHEDLQQFNF